LKMAPNNCLFFFVVLSSVIPSSGLVVAWICRA